MPSDMNATPPVSQTLIASDPAQQNAAAAGNSVKSGANGQDFAAALSNAGVKPTRKPAAHKPAEAGPVRGQLPAPGNLSPPPISPPPAPGPAAPGNAGPPPAAATPAAPAAPPAVP